MARCLLVEYKVILGTALLVSGALNTLKFKATGIVGTASKVPRCRILVFADASVGGRGRNINLDKFRVALHVPGRLGPVKLA